jgi:hypothetical protein
MYRACDLISLSLYDLTPNPSPKERGITEEFLSFPPINHMQMELQKEMKEFYIIVPLLGRGIRG